MLCRWSTPPGSLLGGSPARISSEADFSSHPCAYALSSVSDHSATRRKSRLLEQPTRERASPPPHRELIGCPRPAPGEGEPRLHIHVVTSHLGLLGEQPARPDRYPGPSGLTNVASSMSYRHPAAGPRRGRGRLVQCLTLDWRELGRGWA